MYCKYRVPFSRLYNNIPLTTCLRRVYKIIDMSLNVVEKKIKLTDGREIIIETGKLAKQAHGSVTVRMGDTMLLATVVSNYEPSKVDFLPLSVDYQEKFASAGKIPGGFLRREGRLSDNEILVCRLVDRALRPLFPKNYRCETQIFIQLISYGNDALPDALAALAASAALCVSDIPLAEPISEVRVGRKDGQFLINPSKTDLALCDLELMVAATKDNILMVEGEMKEVSEEEMVEALKVAHEEIKKHCAIQKELEELVGKELKREVVEEATNEEVFKAVEDFCSDKIKEIVSQHIANKKQRNEKIKVVLNNYLETLPEDIEEDKLVYIKKYFSKVEKSVIRRYVLDSKKRLDGRDLNQIRPIWAEVDYLPSAHGSAVFTRGETQSLTSCTLGTKMGEQMIDGAVFNGTNKFMLHYNFPGFSTGECRPNRGPGRREVGHGNLAYRALKGMIPADSPYTIRVVSDILESNGSSSMATVCAGALSMMDAGVKLTKPVSGIAMGLITEGDEYAVLSDILGDEDYLGDMDFKVTGTKDGITACQMDIKVQGLPYEILTNALLQAREGRLHILGEMDKALSAPRVELKPHTPRIEFFEIPKEMIGAIIGPGGKIIQDIQAKSGASLAIEELDNVGRVQIFAQDSGALKNALDRVKAIVAIPEIGEVYEGKVVSIQAYGAFVEFMPGKSGLLHVSEIKWERVDDPTKVLTEGEEIKVKLLAIDPKSGKFKLSRKVLLPKPENKTEKA